LRIGQPAGLNAAERSRRFRFGTARGKDKTAETGAKVLSRQLLVQKQVIENDTELSPDNLS
jgi:hypothetical protein